MVAICAFALLSSACKSDQRSAGDPSPTASAGGTEGASCEALADRARQGKPALVRVGGPQHRALRDIYECHMLLKDDVALCDLVEPEVRANCVALYTFFHAARKAGAGASWPTILGDAIHEDCRNSFDEIPAQACEGMVRAIKAQQPKTCPDTPEPLRQLCSAIASADPKLCGGDSDCEELAGRLALLKDGGGLERVAKEGTRRDRIHARAVLGAKDACEPEIEPFLKTCRNLTSDPRAPAWKH